MQDYPTREPPLTILLNQFLDIGGPELYGPEGLAIMIALWRKSSKLNWMPAFTMTNTELQVQTGIKTRKTLNVYRKKLVDEGVIEYSAPPLGTSRGDYKLNLGLIVAPIVVTSGNNFTENESKPVTSGYNLSKVGQEPVTSGTDQVHTVLIKTLIDRLIDGLDNTKLISRCGVLTTVMASKPLNEVHLENLDVSKRSTEFETYYNSLKGRDYPISGDWVSVQKVAKAPIPMEFILFGIDLAFARHDKTKPYPTATINHFSYCEKVILSTWAQLLKDIERSETPFVPSSDVSRGSSKKTKQQSQLDDLDQIIAEGKRNGPN